MTKMTPFKSLAKGQKIFRLCNLALMLLVALAGAGLAIYYHEIGDPNHRVGASIVVIALAIAPFLVEMIFRFRFNSVIFLAYQVYFIFAALLGSALDLYNTTGWFDIPVHTLMGYTMCLVGMFLLARIEKYEKFNPATIALFCFFFSLSVELVWEIGEFSVDRIFGLTMQGKYVEGEIDPLVTNTVRDLICNLSGATIFLIHYLVGNLTRLKLGMKAIERELTVKGINSQPAQNVNAEIVEHPAATEPVAPQTSAETLVADEQIAPPKAPRKTRGGNVKTARTANSSKTAKNKEKTSKK